MDFIMMPSSAHLTLAFISKMNVPEKTIAQQKNGLFLNLNGTPQPEFSVTFV
jgi:hypothetical protein